MHSSSQPLSQPDARPHARDDARDEPSGETAEERVVTAATTARTMEAIRQAALPVVAAQKCELVSLEYRREPVGWVVRLYVEREGHDPRLAVGGVTLESCVRISRDLSMALDVGEIIDHAFHLEVSSPGLERPLVKPADFARFAGLRAKVQLSQPIDAHPVRKVYRGEIVELRGAAGAEQLLLREDDVGEVTLPFERIAKSNLIVDLKAKPKPGKKQKKKAPPNAHRADDDGQGGTTPDRSDSGSQTRGARRS